MACFKFLIDLLIENMSIFITSARKINKIPKFYMILPEMPEFYITITRRIFFPIFFFWGGARGHVHGAPFAPPVWAVSYAYMQRIGPIVKFEGNLYDARNMASLR